MSSNIYKSPQNISLEKSLQELKEYQSNTFAIPNNSSVLIPIKFKNQYKTKPMVFISLNIASGHEFDISYMLKDLSNENVNLCIQNLSTNTSCKGDYNLLVISIN